MVGSRKSRTEEALDGSTHEMSTLRSLLVAWTPLILLAVALLLLAYWVLDPSPPRRVVLATGVDQGAYNAFGKRYAELLKRHRIEVVLRQTEGAAQNLALLRDPHSGVDVAFVQGGVEADTPDIVPGQDGLMSLGSMFYEPLWLFYRADAAREQLGEQQPDRLGQLVGWRLNVGAAGSGGPPLMNQLLEANHVDPNEVRISHQELTPAVVALLGGDVDALAMVSAPESPMVQMLLQTPGIRLLDFPQAEAYARRFPYMSAVTLPRGVVNLAEDVPAVDMHLVAPTGALIARQHLHPALVQLLVQAAAEVHADAGWFQHRGEFPNADNTIWPLADEAQRYYDQGVPWLQRYLPFWLANLVDRMWVVVVSLVAVLIPLSRIVPPLYEMSIRSRVYRWYGRLRAVEEAQGRRPADELLRELDDIESRANSVRVPLSHTDELYALRSHIQLVRRQLRAAPAADVTSST